MEKQKIYVVKYGSGFYEDYRENIIFATKDEVKANNYIRRYNTILDKLKTYYKKYSNDNCFSYSSIRKEFEGTKISYRYHAIYELDKCFYEEVELR
jgi:hypothetical protein